MADEFQHKRSSNSRFWASAHVRQRYGHPVGVVEVLTQYSEYFSNTVYGRKKNLSHRGPNSVCDRFPE